MITFHEKIDTRVKLPFDIIRGTVKERQKKADITAKKIYKKINIYSNAKEIKQAINLAIAPNKINYDIENFVPNNKTIACLTMNYKSCDKNLLKLDKYTIKIPITQSGKNTNLHYSFHEIRHLIDFIYNPKYSLSKNIFSTPKKQEIYNLFLHRSYNMKHTRKEYNAKKLNIKNNDLIDVLQKSRYSISTELNAYKENFKSCLKEFNLVKAYQESLSVILNYRFIQKKHFINKELKRIIQEERNIIKNKKHQEI